MGAAAVVGLFLWGVFLDRKVISEVPTEDKKNKNAMRDKAGGKINSLRKKKNLFLRGYFRISLSGQRLII